MSLSNDADNLHILLNLHIASQTVSDTKGLVSLEAKLFGSTCISTEGLGKTIANRYNRFVDKVIVKLNQVASIFVQLTNEEKKQLDAINKGEMSSKETTLPVSRKSIAIFLKFVGVVIAWVSMGSLTKFVTQKFKDQRLRDEKRFNEKRALQEELSKCETLLAKRNDRLENRQASKAKMSMFSSLARTAHAISDSMHRTKWDQIEETAERTRNKLVKSKGLSETAHNAKSVFRSAVLGSIIAVWVGMTIWLVNKTVSFFKRLSDKFGGDSTKSNDRDKTNNLYDDDY